MSPRGSRRCDGRCLAARRHDGRRLLGRTEILRRIEIRVHETPPDDLTRDAWESQRRSRIIAPKQLEVQVDELEIERLGQDRAIASFQQLYATEKKALLARKVLELERFEGEWKIVSEQLARDQ